MSASPTPRELEVKLEVSASDLAVLKMHSLPRLGARENSTQKLVSVYYDTEGRDLRKHGLSLRVRRVGKRWIQTIKAGEAASGGMFDRAEWETDLGGGEPDFGAAADAALRQALGPGKRKKLEAVKLKPLFETEVERTTWTLTRGRSEIELALDEGRVKADGRSAPLVEVELELKRGTAGDLFKVVNSLGSEATPRIGVVSKAERGYALADGSEYDCFKAEPVALHPKMSTGDAFQAVARSCLRQFRLNEPILLDTGSAASLHQARVAVRRLRSALSLFKEILADDRIEPLKEQLRDTSARLGAARNLDVFLARSTRDVSENAPGDPAREALTAMLARRRQESYRTVAAVLESQSFRRMIIDLVEWVEAGPWRSASAPAVAAKLELPILEFAALTLQKRRREVAKKGRRLDRLQPERRHRVRIAAKKLRYAAEFFSSLARGKKEERRQANFVRAMEDLQDVLGEMNDIQTGHETMSSLVSAEAGTHSTESSQLLQAADRLTRSKDDASLAQRAVEAHERFLDAKRYWRRWAA